MNLKIGTYLKFGKMVNLFALASGTKEGGVLASSLDSVTGLPVNDKSINGSKYARPISGTGEQGRNRYLVLDNASTILKAEWPAGANIKDLAFFVTPVLGATLTGDEFVLVAIDSVSDASAISNLTQTSSQTADVQWWPIPVGSEKNIPQSAALVNGSLGGGVVHAKTIGGVALNLFIGAC